MKMKELHNKSEQELRTLLGELEAKLLKLNFSLGENNLKDFSQIRKTRKDIARILTLLKSRMPAVT